MTSIQDLYGKLAEDPWRAQNAFSPEVQTANDAMLNPSASDKDIETVLSGWLQEHQPCLFGILAARKGAEHFCIIGDPDLARGDDHVRDKIQAARLSWRRRAVRGLSSGFVIAVVTPALTTAAPNDDLLAFARRICSHYLMTDVEVDKICLDDVFLEVSGREQHLLQWRVGVNFFGAQGDGRWWHDHRIPGGIAFSMNSVGHMVKSHILGDAVSQYLKTLDLKEDDEWQPTKVDSLEQALDYAMRTIGRAAPNAPSGPATSLVPATKEPRDPPCPIKLTGRLRGKDHCRYTGWYHTDVTLPSEYFRANVERPRDISARSLDFTYLFDDRLDNPDHHTTMLGVQVRNDEESRLDLARQRSLKGTARVLTREEAEEVRVTLGVEPGSE